MTQEAFRAFHNKRSWLLSLVALAVTLAFAGSAQPAHAAGVLYFSVDTAPANGNSTITATYAGDITGAGDALGHSVRFSVAPAPGSTAQPRFSDGTTTVTTTLTGLPCDSTQHPPAVTFATNCYASVQVSSTAAGAILVTAQNLNAGGPTVTGTRSFYGAPTATTTAGAAQSGPLNLAGVGDLSPTTAKRVGGTGPYNGPLTLAVPFRDAGARPIAGAAVTCVTTLGSFLETSGPAVTGATGSDGQLPSMTLFLTGAQVTSPAPGTLSCTVSGSTGSLTVTALFATVGAASNLVVSTNKPIVSGVTAAADTVQVTVTAKDTAGNGVTGLETGLGLTLSVAPSGAGNLSPIAATAASPGIYTATYTPTRTETGNGVDSVTITAVLTAQGANLTQTATLVQSGAAATMTLVASASSLTPAGYATLTATLKDAGGRTVATAGAPAISFSTNASDAGTVVIPSATQPAINGVATGVFIPGTTLGPVTVTASTSSGLGAFRVITIIAAPTAPTTPTQQTIVVSATSLFCFKYAGPTKAKADLVTYFNANVDSVNQFNFPAGDWSSWFRDLPSAATINQVANGDILCVHGAIGSNVFATS